MLRGVKHALFSVLFFSFTPACRLDLSVPQGTTIACTSNAECPREFECRVAIGRCVRRSGDDATPPAVQEGSVAITPTAAGADQLVTIAFEVTEQLAAAPVVVLATSSKAEALLVEQVGLRYVFTFRPSGAEPVGSANVLVTLVDTSGNQAVEQLIGSLRLDSVPPVITGIALTSASVLGIDQTGALSFTADEPLAAAPSVTFEDGTPWQHDPDTAHPTYRYTYVATGGETAGTKRVSIVAHDTAGNARHVIDAATIELDFSAPTLTGAATLLADIAGPGQLIGVTFTVSEALAADPIVTLARSAAAPLPMELAEHIGTSYSFVFPVGASTSDGTYTITLASWRDVAGNVAAPIDLGIVTIDSAAPVITALTASPSPITRGSSLSIAFRVADAQATVPPQMEVKVSGQPVTNCTPSGTGPFDFTCAYPVGMSDSEGFRDITVLATDAAGNRALSSTSVAFDFTPPAVAFASVAYQPGAGNPVLTPRAAKVATTITLIVVASERLDTDYIPAITLTNPAGGALVPLTAVTGTLTEGGVTFRGTVPGGVLDGVLEPEVSWRDVAGNTTTTATFADPAVELRVTPKALIIDQARVIFLRSPWGNASSEDLGGFVIPAGPYFALAPSGPLSPAPDLDAETFTLTGNEAPALVRIWSSAARTVLLGTSYPKENGRWERTQLASQDTLRVWISAADLAGNESSPVMIETTEWVATPNPPAFGAAPHAVTTTTRVAERLHRSVSPASAGTSVYGRDGEATRVATKAAWQPFSFTSSAPLKRERHAMSYDPNRGVTVLFGGLDGSGLSETWEWDGRLWKQITPATTTPPVLGSCRMVFDHARDRTALYCGVAEGFVWEWDGVDWTKQTPSGPVPEVRNAFGQNPSFGMAYDPVRGLILVYGGYGGSSVNRNDVWAWDGTSWADVTPPTGPSGGRDGMTFVYAPNEGGVLMFGGGVYAPAYTPQNDTWLLNEAGWTQLASGSTGPTSRIQAEAAYDESRNVVVMTGGINSQRLAETWEWNGDEWVAKASLPAGRNGMAVTYDIDRAEVLVHGGRLDGITLDNTFYRYTGGAWTPTTPATTQPGGRYDHMMVFDEERKRTVLIGGSTTGSCAVYHTDTWTWDGRFWTSGPAGLTGRAGRDAAYDPVRKVVVVYGGETFCNPTRTYFQETLEYNGSSWSPITPTTQTPGNRTGYQLAYDPRFGGVVLYGGADGSYVTTQSVWNGLDWSPVTTANHPGGRASAAFQYDAARNTSVLFGGDSGGTDQTLWTLSGPSGPNWTSSTPSVSPPGRRRTSVAYDGDRQRVVLFGGDGASTYSDSWEWNGTTWADRTPPGTRPSARQEAAIAYDSIRRRTVMFGGFDGALKGDTWELDDESSATAAATFAVDFQASGVPITEVDALTVRAYCGGVFTPYGSGDVGATLYGFSSYGTGQRGGEWRPLESNLQGLAGTAPWFASNEGEIPWSTSGTEARRYFLPRSGELLFQCRPSGTTGGGPNEAAVAVDYFEARVRY